jgi:hypothetical protein
MTAALFRRDAKDLQIGARFLVLRNEHWQFAINERPRFRRVFSAPPCAAVYYTSSIPNSYAKKVSKNYYLEIGH